MSVVPIFRNNVFTPHEVRALEIAYLNACAAVGAATQSPEVKERVATKIVSIAMSGERDPTRIYLRFIEDGPAIPVLPEDFREKRFWCSMFCSAAWPAAANSSITATSVMLP